MQVQAGVFYEFHRHRVVSRAGQPIQTIPHAEVGPVITREEALRQVRSGKDVYTPRRTDAESLAKSAGATKPIYERAHAVAYFQHFHPAGEHPEFPEDQEGRPRAMDGPGHVFFGSRGENA